MGHQKFMKPLRLDQVTLVSVTSVDLPATELAMMISMHDIQFGQVKLLTSEKFIPKDPEIQIIEIPEILNLTSYSNFILKKLFEFIETDFCLLIQADGFVLNASRWQNIFLNYDYIGAPWPKNRTLLDNQIINLEKNSVGNGGFSLRSKKLLLETSKINLDMLDTPTKSEDLIICHFLYNNMLKNGIKFPNPELAAQFSVESQEASYGQNPNTSFGFHGKTLRDHIFEMILNNQKPS